MNKIFSNTQPRTAEKVGKSSIIISGIDLALRFFTLLHVLGEAIRYQDERRWRIGGGMGYFFHYRDERDER